MNENGDSFARLVHFTFCQRKWWDQPGIFQLFYVFPKCCTSLGHCKHVLKYIFIVVAQVGESQMGQQNWNILSPWLLCLGVFDWCLDHVCIIIVLAKIATLCHGQNLRMFTSTKHGQVADLSHLASSQLPMAPKLQ